MSPAVGVGQVSVWDAGELGHNEQAPIPLVEQAAGPAAAGQARSAASTPRPDVEGDRWQLGRWPAERVPDSWVGAGWWVAADGVVMIDRDDPPTLGRWGGWAVGEELKDGGCLRRRLSSLQHR
jgi:hypothetical protein